MLTGHPRNHRLVIYLVYDFPGSSGRKTTSAVHLSDVRVQGLSAGTAAAGKDRRCGSQAHTELAFLRQDPSSSRIRSLGNVFILFITPFGPLVPISLILANAPLQSLIPNDNSHGGRDGLEAARGHCSRAGPVPPLWRGKAQDNLFITDLGHRCRTFGLCGRAAQNESAHGIFYLLSVLDCLVSAQ